MAEPTGDPVKERGTPSGGAVAAAEPQNSQSVYTRGAHGIFTVTSTYFTPSPTYNSDRTYV
jgi:hypothetical protein